MPPFNAGSWKLLAKIYAPDGEFAQPASQNKLITVEQKLSVRLPLLLREFLLEANGVRSDYGSGIIWSVEEIEKRNREFRTHPDFRDLYMPFDNLLFFGDDGGGDQFAFAIQADGQIHKRDIFRWDHESDARSWFAGGLEQFLEIRLKNEGHDNAG